MKITLHLEGTKEQIANQLLDFMKLLAGDEETPKGNAPTGGSASAAPSAKAAGKTGKPVKEAAVEAKEDPAVDDDLGFEEEKEAEPKISKDDTIVALRDFVNRKEGNRAKAKALLEKFGVKSVQDIKEADYEKFMKAVK